jgi:hypothetical protein
MGDLELFGLKKITWELFKKRSHFALRFHSQIGEIMIVDSFIYIIRFLVMLSCFFL